MDTDFDLPRDTTNKIHSIDMHPLGPAELRTYVTEQLNVPISGKEFVVLWAMTGGILRFVHFLMTKEDAFSGPPIVFHREQLISYLKVMSEQMFGVLRSTEWTTLIGITKRNTKGKTIAVSERAVLESLFAKGLLSRLNEKIQPRTDQPTTVDPEKCRYMVSNSFVRSVVRYRAQEDESRPDVIIGDLAGFAFEDIIGRLIMHSKRTNHSYMAAYKVEDLFYEDCGVDVILRKGNENLDLCAVSQEFSQPFLEETNGITSIEAFCSKNVKNLLQEKISEGCTVISCTVVAMTADAVFRQREEVQAAGQRGLSRLRPCFPSIKFSFEMWVLDDILPGHQQSSLPTPSASEILEKWQTIERPEVEKQIRGELKSGFPTLVRGLPGVGKSVSVNRAARAAATENGNVPLHVFDLLDTSPPIVQIF